MTRKSPDASAEVSLCEGIQEPQALSLLYNSMTTLPGRLSAIEHLFLAWKSSSSDPRGGLTVYGAFSDYLYIVHADTTCLPLPCARHSSWFQDGLVMERELDIAEIVSRGTEATYCVFVHREAVFAVRGAVLTPSLQPTIRGRSNLVLL